MQDGKEFLLQVYIDYNHRGIDFAFKILRKLCLDSSTFRLLLGYDFVIKVVIFGLRLITCQENGG